MGDVMWLRPFTTALVNPVTRRFADRLPGFALLTHVGRTSGTVYRTPINVFRHGREWVSALTYGRDAQRVKNVVAAGRCEMITRGRSIVLVAPRIIQDRTRRLMPPVVRTFLGIVAVDEFLIMREDVPDLHRDHQGPRPSSDTT